MVEKISFFRSYYESIKDQDPAVYKEALNAVFAYVFDDAEIDLEDLSPSARMFFILVKPYVDTSLKKSANGKQGGSKSEANQKQTESKAEAKEKQKPSNKNKNKNIEIEEEIEGGNNARARETTEMDGIDPAKLESYFHDQRISLALSSWFADRAQDGRFSFKAMTDEIQRAQAAEKKYGADAVIDTIKASYSYKRIVWDRLERSQPKARSGTEDGFDYLTRRIREEEEKEANNDQNRSA